MSSFLLSIYVQKVMGRHTQAHRGGHQAPLPLPHTFLLFEGLLSGVRGWALNGGGSDDEKAARHGAVSLFSSPLCCVCGAGGGMQDRGGTTKGGNKRGEEKSSRRPLFLLCCVVRANKSKRGDRYSTHAHKKPWKSAAEEERETEWVVFFGPFLFFGEIFFGGGACPIHTPHTHPFGEQKEAPCCLPSLTPLFFLCLPHPSHSTTPLPHSYHILAATALFLSLPLPTKHKLPPFCIAAATKKKQTKPSPHFPP